MKRTAWNSTLAPGKPLERKTGLARTAPIKPVNRERRKRRQEEGEVYGPYHEWVRGQPCTVAFSQNGQRCFGATVGHHVKSVGSGGTDYGNEVPLCHAHHTEVHQIGAQTFELRYGIDLDLEAANLWTKWRAR